MWFIICLCQNMISCCKCTCRIFTVTIPPFHFPSLTITIQNRHLLHFQKIFCINIQNFLLLIPFGTFQDLKDKGYVLAKFNYFLISHINNPSFICWKAYGSICINVNKQNICRHKNNTFHVIYQQRPSVIPSSILSPLSTNTELSSYL